MAMYAKWSVLIESSNSVTLSSVRRPFHLRTTEDTFTGAKGRDEIVGVCGACGVKMEMHAGSWRGNLK